MKKFFTLIMILIFITSCRSLTTKGRSVNSAEKYVKSGNYYGAVFEFSNAFKRINKFSGPTLFKSSCDLLAFTSKISTN